MQLTYREAIIALCPDLTDPTQASIPIAALLLADAGGELIGAAAGVLPAILDVDPISRAILDDVPQLIKRHVRDVAVSLGSKVSVDEILVRLHDALRNSLHVSEILPTRTMEVSAERKELASTLTRVVLGTYATALSNAAEPTKKKHYWSFLRPAAGSYPPVAEATPLTPMPEAVLWPLLIGSPQSRADRRRLRAE
jgi:hypothetical protein